MLLTLGFILSIKLGTVLGITNKALAFVVIYSILALTERPISWKQVIVGLAVLVFIGYALHTNSWVYIMVYPLVKVMKRTEKPVSGKQVILIIGSLIVLWLLFFGL